MRRQCVVIICSLLVSKACFSLTLTPAEYNECIYSYWQSRVNSGVIDAQAARQTSQANLLPNVTANYVGFEDFLANPSIFYPGPYIALTQQLINLSNWADIHAKKISEKVAQLDFEDQLLTLMKSSTNAFYSEIQTAARVKLLQKRISRITKAITLAKETSRLHLADSSSYYWAQADKEALDISITSGQADHVSNLNLLRASIGAGTIPLELSEDYVPEIRNDLSYWTRKIDDLPGIQLIKAKAEAAGAQATSAHNQIYPTLNLTGGYGYNTSINSSAQSALFTVTLSVPIFDQGLRSIQTQQAESQKGVYEAQILSKKEASTAEIENLFNQWQADEKIYKLAKDQLDHNRQGYESLMTLFSFGKTTFLSIRDSESSLVSAEIQLETIKSKIAGEKTILKLIQDYSAGRRTVASGKIKCPIR